MRHGAAVLVGGLACLSVAVAAASLGQQSIPLQQQAPSFRSGTTLVQVDVIVRTPEGRFVGDLKRDELEVLEDGVPQRIDQFHLVADDQADDWAPLPAEEDSAKIEADQRPVEMTPADRRVFALVFDQAHLAFGNGRRAREAALLFLREQLRDGDMAGVLAGNKMAYRRFTTSRAELFAAVNAVPPSTSAAALYNEYFRDWPRFRDLHELLQVSRLDRNWEPQVLARAINEMNVDPNAVDLVEQQERAKQLVESKAERGANEYRRATRETLDVLATLAAGLTKMPGRKTVILFSDGFLVEDAQAELREVAAAAARSDVRIYAIDARGLTAGSGESDLVTADAPEPRSTMQSPDIGFDALQELAATTGGYAVTRRNDLAAALRRIDQDTSSYYILGYRPIKSTPDTRFRRIEVRVKRPRVEVRARKGYVLARF